MNKVMRPHFPPKSEKKTDEWHMKQIREGLRNIFLYFALALLDTTCMSIWAFKGGFFMNELWHVISHNVVF